MYQVNQKTALLDFLLKVSGLKRTALKNALKHQEVYVNHQPESYYAYHLSVGDVVEIVRKTKNSLPFPIIYEDDDLIVIDKPSGLLSDATSRTRTKTAYAMVKDYLHKKRQSVFLVHRLDEDTSGVMMFVKNRRLYQELTHHWNDYVRQRGYLAIVEGKVSGKGHIENYLDENKAQIVYITKNGGKKAITDYVTLAHNKKYSLLDVRLSTGRKNQIRVHMASLHHPVSGDMKYGGHANPIKRLALHAHVFSFCHPFTHQVMQFTSPVPESFARLIQVPKINEESY